MTVPYLGFLTLAQIALLAGGAFLGLGLLAWLGGAGRGRGPGLAVWVMVPFLLCFGVLCVWLLMISIKITGADF